MPTSLYPFFHPDRFRFPLLRRSLGPGLITLLPALLAHAQGPVPAGTMQTLDPVLVTTLRGSDTNTVVRANRMELEQSTSLQDLFRQTPEVAVGGGALPVAQKIFVRGLSERLLSITIDSSGTSPNLGLTLQASEQLTLRLSHSRALRGVGVLEPFLKSFQANAAVLKPEKARNHELGAQWQHGDWQAAASVFRQSIDDYIGYDDMRLNQGRVKVRGYSASAAWRRGNSSISLGMAQAEPTLNGKPLSSGDSMLLGTASGRTWVMQYDQSLPAYNLKLGWTTRLTEQLDFVPAGEASKAGHTIHNIYARWLPTGNESWNLTLSVKNLFNQHYYDQSSFGYHPRWGKVAALPEAGRDVRLSLGARF